MKVCAALGFLVLVGGCSERLSPAECETLLDRYVTMLSASDRPNTSDTELVRLKSLARDKALRDPSFMRCASEVSRSQFQCAMKAENTDRLEQCLL